MERREFDHRSTSQGISVFKWKDTKAVHFISNYHGTDMTTVQRNLTDGTSQKNPCPSAAMNYNAHMGRVSDRLKKNIF